MTRALLLRRRVMRLGRLDWLLQRERRLSDFLLRARTETPIFDEATTQTFAGLLAIGPVTVTRDFVGGCVIRARVRNLQYRDVWLVLQAHLRAADATETGASLALTLRADETRAVELLSQARQKPQALVWTVTAL
ncbi:MAG: hypothetical protein M3Z37_03390 [Candidatus Eremiobacteraeota bacterium]|nr:hypothetical protein [Candidatus Eremiobacteraeota bacterium]